MMKTLARRFHKGKGKYKGKLPIICFNCNKVGHIATRFPKKKNRRVRKGDNYKDRRDEEKRKRLNMLIVTVRQMMKT